MTDDQFKSGFAAIIGAPNVGKSTLLNRMLGEKISITSRKAQTTRNRILGVVHREASQIVFIDTPGIHKSLNAWNLRLVDTAVSALGDVDIILFLVDATTPDALSETLVPENLKNQNKPVVLAINKTDAVKKSMIPQLVESWKAGMPSAYAVIPISARHGHNVDVLLNALEDILHPGIPYFPEDAVTDMPQRFIAAEMIREKVFRFTGQEIPYSSAVTIDKFSERDNLTTIHATIHLERNSQKGIVIGKGASKLKQIGEAARKDIEQMTGIKVFLKLFVRVQKNWTKDTRAIRRFGY